MVGGHTSLDAHFRGLHPEILGNYLAIRGTTGEKKGN